MNTSPLFETGLSSDDSYADTKEKPHKWGTVDVCIHSGFPSMLERILKGERMIYDKNPVTIDICNSINKDMTQEKIDKVALDISGGVLEYIALNYGEQFVEADKLAKDRLALEEEIDKDKKRHKKYIIGFSAATVLNIIIAVLAILI